MDDMSSKKSQNIQRGDPLKKEVHVTRPRSRTVLLTPDVTGDVRAKVKHEELEKDSSGFSRVVSQESMVEHIDRKSGTSSFAALGEIKDDEIKVTGISSNRMATTMATPRPHFTGSNPTVCDESISGGFNSSRQARVNPTITTEYMNRNIYTPENNGSGSEYNGNRQPAYKGEKVVENNQIINPKHDCVVYEKSSPLVGFLISYDNNENGDVLELRVGRLIITSEVSSHGNYVYLDDTSVSPMHAILRVAKGSNIQVLDQLSEFGTKITRASDKKVIELSGEKGVISHGDKISFGERTFEVCLLSA